MIEINRKAQQEMVGFAIILIMVAVILLVVLGSSLKKSNDDVVESYETLGFIQSILQYTTTCENNREKLTIQKLIFECDIDARCLDGRDSCNILHTTLSEILDESWKVGKEYPVKGYELLIISNTEEIVNISKGETTDNSKGSNQDFSRSGSNVGIFFTAYY